MARGGLKPYPPMLVRCTRPHMAPSPTPLVAAIMAPPPCHLGLDFSESTSAFTWACCYIFQLLVIEILGFLVAFVHHLVLLVIGHVASFRRGGCETCGAHASRLLPPCVPSIRFPRPYGQKILESGPGTGCGAAWERTSAVKEAGRDTGFTSSWVSTSTGPRCRDTDRAAGRRPATATAADGGTKRFTPARGVG